MLRQIKTVLFDLDGTLTDPGEGITNSVKYALEHYGITPPCRSELNKFIGPPLARSFMKYYDFSEEKAGEAIEVFREYFREKGIFENYLYDGIPQALSELKESGKTLLVASSKPEVFVKRILDHFDLLKYFSFVGGASLDETRVDKHDVIEYALSAYGITDRASTMMVGDREHDIIGARKSSLHSLGVLYGYGDKKELTDAGAEYIAPTVADLKTILLTI